MPAIKKCVVYCFPIRKQHYSQVPVTHFGDSGPAANSTILLNMLSFRKFNDLPDPLLFDYGTVRAGHAGIEVVRSFHPNVISKMMFQEYRLIASIDVRSF